jgi:riboflavin synthase
MVVLVFSGLISYRGTILSADAAMGGGVRLRARCEGVAVERPQSKDSIAIDGVCLTVTGVEGDAIVFDVVPETLARSTIGERKAGDLVNVEYALRVGDRLGGHFVYGHVDRTARVLAREPEGQGERVRIERPDELAPAILDKAFVAVDGVSLTVARVGDGWFEIALVPETLGRTTLGARPVGSRVNIEVDPIARYAVALRSPASVRSAHDETVR